MLGKKGDYGILGAMAPLPFPKSAYARKPLYTAMYRCGDKDATASRRGQIR